MHIDIIHMYLIDAMLFFAANEHFYYHNNYKESTIMHYKNKNNQSIPSSIPHIPPQNIPTSYASATTTNYYNRLLHAVRASQLAVFWLLCICGQLLAISAEIFNFGKVWNKSVHFYVFMIVNNIFNKMRLGEIRELCLINGNI